jgi:hypothetical protein
MPVVTAKTYSASKRSPSAAASKRLTCSGASVCRGRRGACGGSTSEATLHGTASHRTACSKARCNSAWTFGVDVADAHWTESSRPQLTVELLQVLRGQPGKRNPSEPRDHVTAKIAPTGQRGWGAPCLPDHGAREPGPQKVGQGACAVRRRQAPIVRLQCLPKLAGHQCPGRPITVLPAAVRPRDLGDPSAIGPLVRGALAVGALAAAWV